MFKKIYILVCLLKRVQYSKFIKLCLDFKNKSNNFADIRYDLFIKNPRYVYIFKYLFDKSTEEFAKIFSYTTDEFIKLVNQKKIDAKQAEKFQDSIRAYIKELEITKKLKPSDYLEVVIDNFIKEEKDTLILKLKVDRIVSSKYYSRLLILFGLLSYFGFIFTFSPASPIILTNRNFFLFLATFSVIMGLIMLYLRRYKLASSARLIYIAYVIQNYLNKDNLEMRSFVKKYLMYISGKMYIGVWDPEIRPALREISDIFNEFDDFIKERMINQLDKENFKEVGTFIKIIGLQKTNGHLEDYIKIKKILKEYESKFEIQPPLKPSKYEITLQYAKILTSNAFNVLLNIKFIFWEIIPSLFIAVLSTFVAYIITTDKNTAGYVFAGICALLAVAQRRK
jgi:hypothetical protein